MIDGQDREALINYLMSVKYGFPYMGGISGFSVQIEDNKVKSLKSQFINYKDHVQNSINMSSPVQKNENKDDNDITPNKSKY